MLSRKYYGLNAKLEIILEYVLYIFFIFMDKYNGINLNDYL
jgi:hypothetical protein